MGGLPPKPPKPSLRSAVKATPLRGALRAALTAAALRLIGRQGQTGKPVRPSARTNSSLAYLEAIRRP
jgi:hypothetical protein